MAYHPMLPWSYGCFPVRKHVHNSVMCISIMIITNVQKHDQGLVMAMHGQLDVSTGDT